MKRESRLARETAPVRSPERASYDSPAVMPAGSGPVVQRSEALKGRNTIAQGEALGRQRTVPASPEMAKYETAWPLRKPANAGQYYNAPLVLWVTSTKSTKGSVACAYGPHRKQWIVPRCVGPTRARFTPETGARRSDSTRGRWSTARALRRGAGCQEGHIAAWPFLRSVMRCSFRSLKRIRYNCRTPSRFDP